MSKASMFIQVGGLGALLALASPLAGQEADTKPDYLESLKSCQEIGDDALRLQCYDSAASSLVTASDAGELRIIDSDDVSRTRRGLFGLSLPKIDLFGGNDEEADLFQSVVTNVRFEGRNTVLLTIEDGDAVWRINSATAIVMRTKLGDTVEFKKASLGTYFIRINGRLGVKGRRIE